MRPALAAAALVSVLAGSRPGPACCNDLVAKSARGMVVSVDPVAARVGADVLKSGGNAVDAAVAVAFALAVVHPQAGNLGGGGFLVVRMADGKAAALDFRERAPKTAQRDMYLGPDGKARPKASTMGALAAGVPGSPAGLCRARELWGRKPLKELVEPARRLAAEGFAVDQFLADDLNRARKDLCSFSSTAETFFPGGKPVEVGSILRQRDLAEVLARIAASGPDGFYQGKTADLIVAEMKRSGGIVSAEDLAGYRVVEREVVKGAYRGFEILSMPPPSSGGVALIEMLNILEGFDVRAAGYGSAAATHLLVEAMQRAFADRARFLGDPDFVRVPVPGLVAKDYAALLRKEIDPAKATPGVKPGKPLGAPPKTGETTHFSVVDEDGNAVSCTTTLNSSFGSHLVVPGAGFLLNNEMDDFAIRPGEPNQDGLVVWDTNAIEPGKRMLSSMTPTIVTREGKLFMVLGSPGSGRIINTVLQVIVNVIDHRMPLAQAVAAPRIHHQWLPDVVVREALALSPDTLRALEAMGHKVEAGSSSIGQCEAILVDEKGIRHGAADGRSGGAAIGT